MQAKVGRNYSLEYILSIGRLWLVMFKTSLPTLVEKYERGGALNCDRGCFQKLYIKFGSTAISERL